MAQFNPDVPGQQATNFMGYSKPISTVEADKSKGLLMTGIGEAIKEGTKGLDEAAKSIIDADVHKRVDVERDAFTEALQNYQDMSDAQILQKNAVGDPSTPGAPTDNILQGAGTAGKPGVPLALDRSLDGIDNLHNALGSSKISETYYYGQLTAMAKDLRTQYPGYRDYIDAKISTTTGVTPANAYLQAIIKDVNRQGDAQKETRTKYMSMLSEMVKDGVPSADLVMENYRTGRTSEAYVGSFTNNAMAYKYKTAVQKAALDVEEANVKVDKTRVAPIIGQDVDYLVNSSFQGTFTAGGQMSPQQITDHLQKVVNKETPVDEAQMQQFAQSLTIQRNLVKSQAIQNANVHKPGEKSLADRLGGPEEVEKVVEARLKIYDNTIAAIAAGNYPLALTNVNQMNAKVNQATSDAFNDKDMNDYILHSKVAEKLFPQKFQQDFFMNYGLTPGVMKKFSAPFTNTALKIVTQEDEKRTGVPYTFDKAFEELKAKGVNDPKAYDKLVGIVSMISLPSTPMNAKVAISKAAFSEGNINFLDNKNFNKDYYDVSQQRTIPGKYAVFTRMTSPDITKVLTDKSMDPNITQSYRNWAEETFAQKLFVKELGDLKDLQDTPGFKLKWDSKNYSMTAVTAQGDPLAPHALPKLQASLKNLSMGLRNLGNIEEATNGDVNAYLLNVLKTTGVDLSKNIDGIPEQMTQAILASRKPRKMEDTFDPYNTRNQKKTQDRVYPGSLGR